MLLVYTIADADWSYCMWECGVASDPTQGDPPTRIVVFRATEDVPDVLQDLVSVRTSDEHDIKRFVQHFFKEKDFIRKGVAFNAELSDRILEDYARELYLDLRKVMRKANLEEERRWDVSKLSSLSEGKLILVGRGEVGKTSLVRRLAKNEFRGDEAKTQGINITNWPLQCGSDTLRLNVWDFGGQEIMHATHQFFLTERSLYLLVLSVRPKTF